MSCFVICNPTTSRAAEVIALLKKNPQQHEFQWCRTQPDLTAQTLARQAVAGGHQRIIVVGGDGTISQVANGVAAHFEENETLNNAAKPLVELALIPTGTGNDLARTAGLSHFWLTTALEHAFTAPARPIDLIHVSAETKTMYCINVANGGLGGVVAEDIQEEDKNHWGQMAYWFTCIAKVGDLPIFDIQLDLDDEHLELKTPGLAIANGRYVAGGFPIAPQAKLDDGLISLSVAPNTTSLDLLSAGFSFVIGRHEAEHRVKTYQARQVRIRSRPPMPFSVDGEPVRSFDASFRILPKTLALAVGPKCQSLSDNSENT